MCGPLETTICQHRVFVIFVLIFCCAHFVVVVNLYFVYQKPNTYLCLTYLHAQFNATSAPSSLIVIWYKRRVIALVSGSDTLLLFTFKILWCSCYAVKLTFYLIMYILYCDTEV
jgi:hypothetical protein